MSSFRYYILWMRESKRKDENKQIEPVRGKKIQKPRIRALPGWKLLKSRDLLYSIEFPKFKACDTRHKPGEM